VGQFKRSYEFYFISCFCLFLFVLAQVYSATLRYWTLLINVFFEFGALSVRCKALKFSHSQNVSNLLFHNLTKLK